MLQIASQTYFLPLVAAGTCDFYKLSCLFWVVSTVRGDWDEKLLEKMEVQIIEILKNEISLQKQLEKQADYKTDD